MHTQSVDNGVVMDQPLREGGGGGVSGGRAHLKKKISPLNGRI